MLKLFTQLFDRIIFTLSFILGVQIPEFMQQYLQRLSGHFDEANYQLSQFQHIADLQFSGDLSIMISRYQNNSDIAIQKTGELIFNMVERINHFEQHINLLQQNEYIKRLYYFVSNLDLSIAKATFNDFQLAIPLELNALATGATFALLLLFIQLFLFFMIKLTAKKSLKLIKYFAYKDAHKKEANH